MGDSKELYITREDKFELELIVAELNAKSVRMFLADLFREWVEQGREGKSLPSIEIEKEFDRQNKVNVNYLYEETTAYFARKAAVVHRTNLANYFRSIIHWLCEEHRKNGRLWFDDTHWKDVPVLRRK